MADAKNVMTVLLGVLALLASGCCQMMGAAGGVPVADLAVNVVAAPFCAAEWAKECMETFGGSAEQCKEKGKRGW
jgi:hypothetical protein